MMRLFIIGNGFDLHHSIKSSYKDFREFLGSTDRNLLNTLEKFNLNGDQLWSDFEANLVDLNEEDLRDYYADSLVSPAADDWSDKYNHEYQFLIEQDVGYMTFGLKKSFLDWILNLHIDNGCKFDEIRQMFTKDVNRLFLNFNYTNSLEIKYGVDESEVLYIHNKAINRKSNLILGHSINDKSPEERLWNGDFRIAEAKQSIIEYYRDTCKFPLQVLATHQNFFDKLVSATEVIVLGQSISEVDTIYFSKIIDITKNRTVIWRVSYFDDHEKKKHLTKLMNLGIDKDLIHHFKMQDI
jgi:DNA polymerase III delta prime subunit